MKLSQIFTAPNQLTLLRMVFVPFIVIHLVDGHYKWALIVFVIAGFSDGLDGLFARTLHQQTLLGQYLDPIADKLLLSTIFLVLSILHKIPWKYTVMVFSRDISILAASAVLFAIAGLRDFRPSIFGKANTFSQISAVFFVLLSAGLPGARDLDCPYGLPARNLLLHNRLRTALRHLGPTENARTYTRTATGSDTRFMTRFDPFFTEP